MKISASDINAFEKDMNAALNNGEKYMVVPREKNTLIQPSKIRFAKTEGEAENVRRHENGFTKWEHIVLTVDDMKKALDKYLHERDAIYQGKQSPDFYADAKVLKFQVVSRKELALQDTYRHLKVRGIEPDMKELRKQIFKETPAFTVKGVNSSDGIYDVKIEQNLDRSYQVHAIEPKHIERISGMVGKLSQQVVPKINDGKKLKLK